LPSPGTRILYQKQHLGTVRFAGPVDGTSGEWLGVEWDEAESRGKHDGVKDGKRYFDCVVPHSASFVRYSPNTISLGTNFLSALFAKYVDDEFFNSSVMLGSSNGLIEVEAPNLDRVRKKVADIQKLKEISLDEEGVAGCESDEDEGWRSLQNVRGLNLSKNLLSSWDVIRHIVIHMPLISELDLSRNRFHSALPAPSLSDHLISTSIRQLRLNNTLVSWSQLSALSEGFPNLEGLQFSFNRLSDASMEPEGSTPESLPFFGRLQSLFLDGNRLTKWTNTDMDFELILSGNLCSLRHLHLASNQIDSIPRPTPGTSRLALERIQLTSNALHAWSDLDALSEWCPHLEVFSVAANPIIAADEVHARPLVIGRMGTLTILDGSNISHHERQDSELFYLSTIAKSVTPTTTEDERIRAHPRWVTLCEKHGRPDEPRSAADPKKQTTKLIGLTILAIEAPISVSALASAPAHDESAAVTIRLLPTMTVRVLRLKIAKTLKLKNDFRLWILLRRG
ncbi:RNI-like protein, partial [Clavulina sp. PMI_390]